MQSTFSIGTPLKSSSTNTFLLLYPKSLTIMKDICILNEAFALGWRTTAAYPASRSKRDRIHRPLKAGYSCWTGLHIEALILQGLTHMLNLAHCEWNPGPLQINGKTPLTSKGPSVNGLFGFSAATQSAEACELISPTLLACVKS